MAAFLKLLQLTCLICAFAVGLVCAVDTDATETQFVAIAINGRTLSGPNSLAHRRDGRLLLPLSIIARAFGDRVSIDTSSRMVAVRRQNGVAYDFDLRNGRLRRNGTFILEAASAAEIAITGNPDELMLPVEIVAALLDVSVRFDTATNVVEVKRGAPPVEPPDIHSQSAHHTVEVHNVDYEYDLNRYSSGISQNLTINAVGRLGDGRVSLLSNSNHTVSGGISVRNTTFTLERPNGQRYLAGDLGTGGELQFLSANLRGASVSLPMGETVITAFGGRSISGNGVNFAEPLGKSRSGSRYDTTTAGAIISGSTGRSRGINGLSLAAGALHFNGPDRRGDLATGSIGFADTRFRVQSDVAFGNFSGLRNDGSHFTGIGFGLDVGGTLQVTRNMAVQGRYTRVDKNFLGPQAGIREALDLKAAGVAWSPAKWMSASVNVSSSRRPGDREQDNKFVTVALAITPSAGLPRFYVSHTQSRSRLVRSGAFTIVNVARDFSRLRLYANATRIQNIGPASVNAQLGANYSISDSHSVEFSQALGNRQALNGQLDWRVSNLLGKRVGFTAGFGYSRSKNTSLTTYERLSASVKLPGQNSLQVNYFHANGSSVMLVSLRGTIFKRRESGNFLTAGVSQMNSYGKVSGRVYQDIDGNGRFDPGDKPQAEVKVRVDGNRYVVSNAEGLYSFDSVSAGEHKIYLDLLSVRADLTLLGSASRDTRLVAGGVLTQDFRLVRTGRTTGRVWLDGNGNGKFDPGESPLADIRVVTADGRDTLTNDDGFFTLADLPPGEHIVFLDEKSLPEATVAGTKHLAVQCFAGRETTDANLSVAKVAAEVKIFTRKEK